MTIYRRIASLRPQADDNNNRIILRDRDPVMPVSPWWIIAFLPGLVICCVFISILAAK